MNRFLRLVLPLALGLICMNALAVTIVQCEDEFGGKSFQERCPPGSKVLEKRQYGTKSGEGAPRPVGTVTLYRVANCDSCDQVQEFLDIRNIQYDQKDVSKDVDLQNELKEKAGELRVPVTVIGEQIVSGYNREALLKSLGTAGYNTGEQENAPAASAQPEATEEPEASETPEEPAPTED